MTLSLAEQPARTMRSAQVQYQRRSMLDLPHIAPLTQFAASLRIHGEVPDFDPLDGGVAAEALFLRLGYPGRKIIWQAIALIAYAAVLEYLQHYSPGRTPAVADWIFSSSGALVGSAIGLLLVAGLAHRRPALPSA